MAIFGLKVKDSPVVEDFVKKFQKKLNNPDMTKNPFTGYVESIGSGSDHFLLIWLDIIWPNPIIGALILTIGVGFAYNFQFHWLHILLLPLYMVSFMFTSLFAKLAMRFSLKKQGYEGKIKTMTERELLLRLAGWHRKI